MSPNRSTTHAAIAWGLVVAYMGGIFYMSAQSTIPIPMIYPFQDKVMHMGAYFGLGMLLSHAIYGGSLKRRFALAFLIAALYGASDEIHQMFVPGRDCSFFDWLADIVGAWLGTFAYLSTRRVPGSSP